MIADFTPHLYIHEYDNSFRAKHNGLTAVGMDGSDGSHGARELRPAGAFARRALPGVDGSDPSQGMCEMRLAGTSTRLAIAGVDGWEASHGMCEMRSAGTSTCLARAGVDGWDASHGMCEARTAGTLICLTLRSGAIHSSDAAPLLKKLSCTAALSVRCLLDVHECCRGILSSLITLY